MSPRRVQPASIGFVNLVVSGSHSTMDLRQPSCMLLLRRASRRSLCRGRRRLLTSCNECSMNVLTTRTQQAPYSMWQACRLCIPLRRRFWLAILRLKCARCSEWDWTNHVYGCDGYTGINHVPLLYRDDECSFRYIIFRNICSGTSQMTELCRP